MKHRVLRLTVALGILALGVILATAPAQASNMGFKLERTLTYRDLYFNYYFASFPFFRSFPDWDNDTVISSDDVLIDLWQKSHPDGTDLTTLGSLTISGFDNSPGSGGDPTDAFDNQYYGRQIFAVDATTFMIVGSPSVPFPVDEVSTPGWRGYLLQVGGNPVDPGTQIDHATVVVGSHNPAVTQAAMPFVTGYFNFYIVSVPYHSTWTEADEVLCAAWNATTGSTDCTTPDNALSIGISSFDNEPGGASPNDNAFIGKQIFSFGALPQIVGNVSTLPIVPGEGYLFQVEGNSVTLPFPHY